MYLIWLSLVWLDIISRFAEFWRLATVNFPVLIFISKCQFHYKTPDVHARLVWVFKGVAILTSNTKTQTTGRLGSRWRTFANVSGWNHSEHLNLVHPVKFWAVQVTDWLANLRTLLFYRYMKHMRTVSVTLPWGSFQISFRECIRVVRRSSSLTWWN